MAAAAFAAQGERAVEQGQLVIVRLRNGRLLDGSQAGLPVKLPDTLEFTVGGKEITSTLPVLDTTVRGMEPKQREAVTLPAASDLKLLYDGPPPDWAASQLAFDVELLTFRSRHVRPGNGERPSQGHVAAVRLSDARLRGTGPSEPPPLSVPQVAKVTVGGGDFVPGLEEAVAQMSLGEVAEVTIPPLGAYGAAGCFGAVPPNAAIQVKVELLGFS